jgi:hypothetical protein
MDPVSLAAIQALTTESDIARSNTSIGAVRDGIEGVLDAVPCSRIQAAFDPDSGTMELRGHIPEDGLRGPVLGAMRSQLGNSIPVRDNLLILPRPQCGALSGIAAVGLPQSTDQFKDPKLIGEDTHVRAYSFHDGERLILDLTAPEYPAYIYMDFFDAAGDVVHLVPNERVLLERYESDQQASIGADREDGNFLEVTISPPYGQEIAVAFAASHRLYSGARPLKEAAGPYLEWLQERVTEARRTYPDFKGEWVYFFVSTGP